ncbi:NAD-dependent epimerase/dehydratase family protein [candidate division KSB1 bacterium]|nr:NAD-dependent epimerase/dehydratase family protein [candidate division KSB1 bacterium]
MKILVTGGAGFIGSHVVDAYIEQGHDVVVMDNLVTGYERNINQRAKFYKMDIQDADVLKVFEKEKFDIVNHHAAQMDVRRSVSDPVYDAKNNILGSINLMQAAITTDVKKFIFVSSGGAIYGEQVVFPADEEHDTWPLSPYGITKLTGEKYLYFYSQTYGLNYAVLRYANIYGPRQNPHGEAGVVAIFTTKLLNREQPIINGDGKQTRDYVFVGDVVRANLNVTSYEKNDYFNIGTSIETDVNEIFDHLNEFTGDHAKELHGPAKPGEQLRSVLNYEKAKRLLHWKPEVMLKDGLQRTVDYFSSKK